MIQKNEANVYAKMIFCLYKCGICLHNIFKLNSASATEPIIQNLHRTKKAERIPKDSFL